jgi:hypothetical protein
MSRLVCECKGVRGGFCDPNQALSVLCAFEAFNTEDAEGPSDLCVGLFADHRAHGVDDPSR